MIDSYCWIPACGGTEKSFLCNGKSFLYMWNTKSKEHKYYCETDDMFIEDCDLKFYGLGAK